MRSISPVFYYGLVAFFTLVFAVFYVVSYSVIRGIVENYRRYYQKADLQWTGPREQPSRDSKRRLFLLLAAALGTAWLVVHFIIFP